MRRIIALSFLLVSSNAYAFSGPVTAAEWYAVHELCRLGQMADGAELSKNDNDAACAERDKLQKELAANGYCWNNDEQEWAACTK
jgi:hypothetical protein